MSDDTPLAARLAVAPETMLQEILRQAEAHLSAQLTAAIASDQRAYTFAGLISAVAVVLAGGAYSLETSGQPNHELAFIAAVVALSQALAIVMAIWSARSVGFEFAGSQPRNWVEDVEAKKEIALSLAEQCQHYDGMIVANRRVMESNSRRFNTAVRLAIGMLILGLFGLLGWLSLT